MKLDFFKATHSKIIKGKDVNYLIYPEFYVRPSKDLMIRGGKFYAVINKDTGFWEMDEYKIQEFVDDELKRYYENEFRIGEGENAADSRKVSIRDMMRNRSKSWIEYRTYVNNLPDNWHQLDEKLCFSNTKVEQKDYISHSLPYPLKEGSHECWDTLIGTLYNPEERQKIEWAIGAVISGDSKDIQKFIVLYGDPGAGKGTVLKIIQMMFPGYYEMFDAKSVASSSNAFAFEQFRSNPLIAIQTDGDLSRIEDNTKLNSLVSHETIVMNEKRKQSYNFTPRCFLFMASNHVVQITDGKSGLLRRLIDVTPTGNTLPKKEYDRLMNQIGFELGGIAWHCLNVYRELGKNYYNSYKPVDMMARTNAFYNFVFDKYDVLTEDAEGISLSDAYDIWTDYQQKTGLEYKMPRYRFKEELKNYFAKFDDQKRIGDKVRRSWYSGGIDPSKFENGMKGRKDIPHDEPSFGLVLDQKVSLLDDMLKDCQAQYGVEKPEGGSKPRVGWDNCRTTLKDLDTTHLHFIRIPKNHIVIDFDLKNDKGEKDALLNLEAADQWPRTYAEFSQGGKGIHLHYIYDGNPDEIATLYSKDIEIKIYKGKESLRRRLSLCNNIPVAVLSGGLPKKEATDGNVIDFDAVKNEQHLRNIVAKCLRKDIQQPYTSTAMSLIKKTLDDAYESGISYDIRDMRPAIRAFAAKSTHQKDGCMKMESELKYCSKDHAETTPNTKVEKQIKVETKPISKYVDETLVFFDIEVFPNLLLVNWKEAGEGKGVVRMINPTRSEIGELFRKKLVGFNCRRYDNHILYARYMGYDNEQLYRLSQRIIAGSNNAMFGNAYDISYTDVYDFAAKKQSLKKWEIQLGIHHQELGLPWDEPVPPEEWDEVAKYCDNDVIATEAVFNYLAGDFKAREILAEIAGMKVNDTTNQLTTRIIFGDDPQPQRQFNYPDLAKEFPGYIFTGGKSYYRHFYYGKKRWSEQFYRRWVAALTQKLGNLIHGINDEKREIEVWEEIGEGGRVYAVPGIHHNVVTFDVASMHPSSIIAENGFGKYTDLFKQLLDIRIAIKHRDFEAARKMLDGKLAKYLNDPDQADALSQALKIAINSVYGLTAAGFDNKFRDPRNKDNWVAKRGALFIETLRLKVTRMGGKVVHIKTDSIKVEEPTEEIQKLIMDYGREWGYTFEIEDIYDKMCLVNDAVYIALRSKNDPGWLKECKKAKKKAEETGKPYIEPTRWAATGAQFAHPYVFKTLFSHEDIDFRDLCETKTVTSALYLDMNENLSDVSQEEKDLDKLNKRIKVLLKELQYDGNYDDFLKEPVKKNRNPKLDELSAAQIIEELIDLDKDRKILNEIIGKGHNYVFIGRAGSFCPVRPGFNGGILCREKDGKYSAATGSKGYRWCEGEALVNADRMDIIDMKYFDELSITARESIDSFARRKGSSFESFADENDIQKLPELTAKEISIDDALNEILEECDRMLYASEYQVPPFDDQSIKRFRELMESLNLEEVNEKKT